MPNGDRNRPREWELTGVVRAFALALVVVTATALAGCGALSGGSDGAGGVDAATDASGPTPTRTPSANERLAGKLSAPPETVFERVETMTGLAVDPDPEVEYGEGRTANDSEPFFAHLVGLPENRSTLEGTVAVTYGQGGRIQVDPERLASVDGPMVERQVVFWHLYTAGLRRGWIAFPFPQHRAEIVQQAFWYVINAYGEQHRPEMVNSPEPYNRTASDYEWAWERAQNYYAYQWVSEQVDSPAEVRALLGGELPASDEPLLTGDADDPMALGLELNTSESWYRSEEQDFQSQGAVTTKAVLRTELGEERAHRAAEGWGQDRFFVVNALNRDERGVVWVHRWDSPQDADEYEQAMRAYLAHRRNETDDLRFEYRRLAPDATAVVVGPPAFANATTVAYDTGNATAGVGVEP